MEQPTRLERPHVEAMDALLGEPFPVLDQGFLRVVDYMGDDAAVVQAARVSYGKGTKRVQDDRGLIRTLMREYHTTPFECCSLKLHVRVPMDCWRQWIRHRTAHVNEYSTRYSEAIDACQTTQPTQWRRQAASNRQGSAGTVTDFDLGVHLTQSELELQTHARAVYDARLRAGVAREQARKDLPLSTYTEAYWTIDLHNLLHFLQLRLASDAQQEIRAYATIISDQVLPLWCPLTAEAFRDYRLKALSLSRMDIEIIASLAAGDTRKARCYAEELGWLAPRSREGARLRDKLTRLNLDTHWGLSHDD